MGSDSPALARAGGSEIATYELNSLHAYRSLLPTPGGLWAHAKAYRGVVVALSDCDMEHTTARLRRC